MEEWWLVAGGVEGIHARRGFCGLEALSACATRDDEVASRSRRCWRVCVADGGGNGFKAA